MTTDEINSTGPTDEAGKEPSQNDAAPASDKVLVLAVGVVDGNLVITPIDLEFEADDQSPLSKAEQSLFKKTQTTFEQHRHEFQEALKALHILFAGRLCREKFASFDKFCFALQGMSLPEKKLAELKAKASKPSLTPDRK
jgi:hypothetical protein